MKCRIWKKAWDTNRFIRFSIRDNNESQNRGSIFLLVALLGQPPSAYSASYSASFIDKKPANHKLLEINGLNVRVVGLEPTTHGLKGRCSAD